MVKIIYVDLCFRKPTRYVTLTISRITRIKGPSHIVDKHTTSISTTCGLNPRCCLRRDKTILWYFTSVSVIVHKTGERRSWNIEMKQYWLHRKQTPLGASNKRKKCCLHIQTRLIIAYEFKAVPEHTRRFTWFQMDTNGWNGHSRG